MDLTSGSRHLLDYWHILVKRRWIIYLAVASVTLAALVGSYIVTPLYRGTVTLQIQRQNPSVLTFKDVGNVDYSYAAYADFYETQYRIIASPAIASRVVERMRLLDHPEFSGEGRKPSLLARLKSLVPRRGVRVPQSPEDVAAARILASLEVSPVRNSHLVHVSYTAPVPEMAAEIANAVASAYVRFNLESSQSVSTEAEEFLVDQTAELRTEIATLEQRLQEYGEAKRIVSIDESNNITLKALNDIAEKRTAAQTELARATARYTELADAPSEALPEVLESDLISRLREEYAAYEAEYSEMRQRFQPGWPALQSLKSKLDQSHERLDLETERIAQQVRAAARARYDEARQEVRNLDAALSEQEDAAQRLKRDAVEYANLQSEVRKKREMFDALIARHNEMSMATRLADDDKASTNIRILERAKTPGGPYRPNIRLNLMLGLFAGLAIGIGMAFFLEYLDNTVSTANDLSQVISMPVLAVIPHHGEQSTPLARVRRRQTAEPAAFDFIAHADGQAGPSEAYRELRTSILLSSPGKPPRQIMVSSAHPEEGKTATVINLGVVLSQLGQRVLLVDTDLRRPRLHKAFGLSNRHGVSTVLSGMEATPESLIVHTAVDNLDLLPSGPVPPNPSELLNSSAFSEMRQWLLERGYAHVIYDSPPVLAVADPVVLASMMDVGVLVVRAGRTPRQSIKAAEKKFEQAGGGRFGVVLNDVPAAGLGQGYYRYQYRERYGQEAEEQTRPDDSRRDSASA